MRVRVIVMGLVLVFLSSSAFALIGPPTAELTKGQWSAGFNYQYSSTDLDSVKFKDSGVEYDPDLDELVPYAEDGKVDVKDFNINAYFGRLSYGLLDSLEVYGQVGISDLKFKARDTYIDPNDPDEWSGTNLDNEFAWGAGAKYTFYKQEKMDWGVGCELNSFSNSLDEKYFDAFDASEVGSVTIDGKENFEVDTIAITIVAGPTIDMDGWKLYGGLLCQILSADFDGKYHSDWTYYEDGEAIETGVNEDGKNSASADVTSLGGYLGASMNLYENYNMQVEVVGTSDGWGAGAGVTILF